MRILKNIVIVRKIIARCLADIRALRYQKRPEWAFSSREDKDVGVDSTGGHPAMDYAEHRRTYEGFLRLTKFVIAALALLLIGMKIFLV